MPVTTWIKMASLCHFQVRKGCLRPAGTKKISLKLYSNFCNYYTTRRRCCLYYNHNNTTVQAECSKRGEGRISINPRGLLHVCIIYSMPLLYDTIVLNTLPTLYKSDCNTAFSGIVRASRPLHRMQSQNSLFYKWDLTFPDRSSNR